MSTTRNKLLFSTGTLFIGTALTRLLSAGALIVIARQLGVEANGQYVSSLSFAGLTSVLFTLGLDGLMLRDGAKRREDLPKLMAASVVLKALLGIVWIVAMVAVTPLLDQSVYSIPLVVLASIYIWLDAISSSALSGFKAVLNNHITLLLMAGSQVVLLGVVWVSAFAFKVHDAQTFLLVTAASALITTAVTVVAAIRALGWRLDASILRGVALDSMPFAVSVIFASIYGRADVTIVANTLGKTAVGIYGPAISLLAAFVLVPAAVYGVMVPVLSQMYARDADSVRRALARLMFWMLLSGVALSAIVIIGARPLVHILYGAEFDGVADVLMILSGVMLLRCVNFGLASVLVAVGWQGRRVVVQGASAIINVVLNLFLVAQWGVAGAAAVYVFSELVLAIGYAALVYAWNARVKQALQPA